MMPEYNDKHNLTAPAPRSLKIFAGGGGGWAEISGNQLITRRNVKAEIVTGTMKEHYMML